VRRLLTCATTALLGLAVPAAAQATIVTSASPAIPVVAAGSALSDTATLSGLTLVGLTATVTFELHGPADADCSGVPIFTDLQPFVPDMTQAGGAVESDAFAPVPSTVGDYRWVATYSDDGATPTEATACGDPGEVQTLAAPPTIVTQASPGVALGGQLSDAASISGLLAPATGPATFELFGPNDGQCALQPAYSISIGVSSTGPTTATAGSGDFTPTAAGQYRWRVSFDGDASNAPAAGACGAPVVVSGATPVLTTQASADITLGGATIGDEATVAGVAGVAPTGTMTFHLYGPDDATCSGGSIATFPSQPLTAAGQDATAASPTVTPAATGDYRWTADFSTADLNYASVSAPCNAAGERVTVSPFVAAPPPPPAAVEPPPAPAPPPPAPAPPPPPPPAPACDGRTATIVGTGRAAIAGTARADVIVGTAAAESIDGGGGSDTICAGAGADRVRGGAGDDTIRGGDGDDRIQGDAGRDRLSGEAGADQLLGGAGDDDLRAGAGRDSAAGGDGDDRVDGGAGDDRLDDERLGGRGRDRLFGGPGADTVRTAGGGTDTVDCGVGRDSVLLDRHDRQRGCERIRRS
jgi:Ca2+-binding RTX toxin-like protein